MKSPLQRIQFGAISLAFVVILSITAFHYIGGYDWLESVWIVVVTISTVGFGEESQNSPALQIVTICVILLGVSSAVYTCGGFIQLLLEGEVEHVLGRRKMTKEISKLDGHVIICGFGRLGQDLATQLQHRGIPFIIIDLDEKKVQLAQSNNELSIHGDATSELVLEQANLSAAKALATALPTDAENVFITLTARNLRPDIQIIAKSERESSCRKLRQAGADKIIMPHRVGAQQMERMISRPTTADLVELFAEASHLEMELDEFRVSKKSTLVGSTLSDSNIKENFNLLVVGIKNRQGDLRFNPSPQDTINDEDTLLVIGQVDDINRMKLTHQI